MAQISAARVAPEKAVFPTRPAVDSFGRSLTEKLMATYWGKLRDPRWQRRRLEVMSAAGFKCQCCGAEDKTLNVHHKLYRKGASPWEYESDELQCLCENCHADQHQEQEDLDRVLLPLPRGVWAAFCAAYAAGDIDPGEVYMAREYDRESHADGLVARLCSFLPMEKKLEAAMLIAALSDENSEARPIFEKYRHVFGNGDE